jgi:hypothetical protein
MRATNSPLLPGAITHGGFCQGLISFFYPPPPQPDGLGWGLAGPLALQSVIRAFGPSIFLQSASSNPHHFHQNELHPHAHRHCFSDFLRPAAELQGASSSPPHIAKCTEPRFLQISYITINLLIIARL